MDNRLSNQQSLLMHLLEIQCVSADGSEYIDLANTYLKLTVKVVDKRPDKDILDVHYNVAATNYKLHAWSVEQHGPQPERVEHPCYRQQYKLPLQGLF